MKNLIFFILLVYIVFFLVVLFSNNGEPKVCINKACVKVDIADSNTERALGLMYVEELDWDKGMLFVFDKPSIYKFWMKNTKIPLDIIWIDNSSEIVYIYNAEPCKIEECPSFGPDIDAIYVLEVNSGYSQLHNISIGDYVDIQKSL